MIKTEVVNARCPTDHPQRRSREALAFVTLDYEGRFLRRKRLVTDSGEPFLVELPETVSLSSTDGFVLDDNRVVAIKAKSESLLKVKHAELSRIAWHIGNRHTPCQVELDHLLIKEDYVMEDLLRLLGADIEKLQAPFFPEGGAYGHGRTHNHSHNHSDQQPTPQSAVDFIQQAVVKSDLLKNSHKDVMTLQAWFSPAFPTGAFSYSHGMESAIHDGLITDAESLKNWIALLLSHGSGRNDGLFLKAAYEGVAEANALCLALCSSKERFCETTELGQAFIKVVKASYGVKLPDQTAYPIAVGKAARKRSILT